MAGYNDLTGKRFGKLTVIKSCQIKKIVTGLGLTVHLKKQSRFALKRRS